MGGSERAGRCERRIEYRSLPSQARFHASQARFKGFSGPIGSGKSQALCQEAVRMSYINAGRLGLVGAPTYPMLRDATQATLFEILDRNRIPYDFNKAENVLTLRDTRSRVVFRAVDEFDRLRGTNLAWFGVDELTYTPQDAWLVLEGRLRDPRAKHLCGFAVWTPKGYDWVYKRFLDEPVAGYEAVVARPMENRYLLERVPDFYERLKHSYDETFFRQEVLGEYVNSSGGRVYNQFDRKAHVGAVTVDPRAPLLWALDFNVDPMCSIVAQVCGETVQVLGEIVLSRATTLQACEEFHARYRQHAAGVVVFGDASGARQQTTGSSDYQIIQSYFRREGFPRCEYRVPKANPAVRERVMLVNAKLKSASGEVHLRIDGRCKGLVKDLEQVVYKAESTVIDKERDPKLTHLSDALGYLIWQECRKLPAVGYRSQRLL
ncbi:MAG: hypothetical protein HY822_08540 [Acidobacteria bacterium]|nr:hypothetical protein [Acidobacteriota bacterium]